MSAAASPATVGPPSRPQHWPRRFTASEGRRQLGYKQAKYIMRIEIVDNFAGLWDGNGGFWEDRGYEWYAGDLISASCRAWPSSFASGSSTHDRMG